jgi:lipopolysaccharide transport system ATP-binding protein
MVSHNPAALASLCTRGVVLEQGATQFDGPIQDALHRYKERGADRGTEWTGPSGDDELQLARAWVQPADGSGIWDTGRPLEIGAELLVHRPVDGLVFGFRLQSDYGADLAYSLFDDDESGVAATVPPGRIVQTWQIPANTLSAGRYRIAFEVALAYRRVCHQQPFGELAVELQNLTGLGRRYPVQGVRGFDSLLRPRWGHERRIEPLAP